jgi:metal-sulfur cluster biosynthetic enzyme
MITPPEERKSHYWDELNEIIDPEVGIGIVDLGLIYKIDISEDGVAEILMTLTSPACPVGPAILQQVHDRMIILDGIISCHVELTFDPPWTNELIDQNIREMILGL